jgi:hypothetical protein
MVDLAQPTNALVRLQTARTYLQTYISHLNTALSAAKNCTNPLSTLQDAQVSYVLYQSELQAAATVLNPYIAALIDPALATLEQKKSGLTQFGISRTVTGTLDRDVECICKYRIWWKLDLFVRKSSKSPLRRSGTRVSLAYRS